MTAEVLAAATNSLLQHHLALRHPVFIPVHIELEMYWGGGMDGDTMGNMGGNAGVDAGNAVGEDRYVWKEFPIHYVQDGEDTFEVAEITFPQLEGIGEYWMIPYDGAGGLFQSYSGSVQDGRYQLKQLFVKMVMPTRSLEARGITLDTMKVRYGDGAGEEVSIGQTILTLGKPMEYVTVTGGSFSSDGTSTIRCLVQRDCRLEGSEIQNPEQTRGEFKVIMDGTDIWEWEPAAVIEGDTSLVESTWRGTGDTREQFGPYTVLIQQECSDGSGGESWSTINPDRQNSRNADRFKQTYRCLKEEGIKP